MARAAQRKQREQEQMEQQGEQQQQQQQQDWGAEYAAADEPRRAPAGSWGRQPQQQSTRFAGWSGAGSEEDGSSSSRSRAWAGRSSPPTCMRRFLLP